MRTVMTPTGAFGFYAGLNLIGWALVFCFVRETKQLTLEEIDRACTFINPSSSCSSPLPYHHHLLLGLQMSSRQS
jgi:hypothetical protein